MHAVASHIAVVARDSEKVLNFYRVLLGGPPLHDRVSHVAGGLPVSSSDNLHLSVGPANDEEGGRRSHGIYFYFGVADLDAALARLQQAGGKRRGLPFTIDAGDSVVAVQYVEDPDGNVLGLTSVKRH